MDGGFLRARACVCAHVQILAECIRRCDPPFPLGEHRVDLAVVVLQVMFSLGDALAVSAMGPLTLSGSHNKAGDSRG